MAETTGRNDELAEPVPKSHWTRLVIFLIDTTVLIASVVVLRYLCPLLLGCEFVSLRQFVKSHAEIVNWCAWPVTGLIFVLLFRDVLMRILYQLPSFVSRSQYGKRDVCHGKKERQDPSREDVPKDASDNTSGQGGNQLPQSKPQKTERMTREEGRRAESLALQKISSEYRCEIMRESCVRGTSYVFDGIMKDNGLIYGVEVKCGYNRESIQHTLRRFSELFVSLPIKAQETFTPILCVVAKQPNERWKEELMDVVSRSEVRVILRMYSLDDLLNK